MNCQAVIIYVSGPAVVVIGEAVNYSAFLVCDDCTEVYVLNASEDILFHLRVDLLHFCDKVLYLKAL